MNILTISDSPYLITRNARINRDICTYLSNQGHHVDSMVFNHENFYFLPDTNAQSHYQNIRLFPFEKAGRGAVFAYDVMKKSQPNVVISIGHYSEAEFVYEIKSLYPHLFKWIFIVTSGTSHINEKTKDALSYVDHLVALNSDAYDGLKAILPNDIEVVRYGAGNEFFDKGESRSGVLMVAKNSQISNIQAYIRALEGIGGELHYNANDEGFYDVPLLQERYGKHVKLPEKFISIREGVSDAIMNDLYNSHSFVVDCSMQSTTSISMLEAMRAGCIPIGVNTGASKDMLTQLPEEYQFIVDGDPYIGEKEESYFMASVAGLNQTVKKAIKMSQDKEWEDKGRNIIKSLSTKFSKDNFLGEINRIMQKTIATEAAVVIDDVTSNFS